MEQEIVTYFEECYVYIELFLPGSGQSTGGNAARDGRCLVQWYGIRQLYIVVHDSITWV